MSKKGNSGEKQTESTAVATTNAGGAIALPAGFAVRRVVTVPVCKLEEFKPKYLLIRSPIAQSTYEDPNAEAGADGKRKRASVCEVADVVTGELGKLVVATVLEKNLREMYPNDEYVGRTFYVEKLAKRPGKRYMDYKVAEIEQTGAEA